MALKSRRANHPTVKKYEQFKPALRYDFTYECVFCRLHENELGGPRLFSVEHLKPKKKFPALELVYSNTLYSCVICNSFKVQDWPSDNPTVDGKGYIDPCFVDYDDHFKLENDYKIVGTSDVGKYMAKRLHLGRRQVSKKLKSRTEAQKTHQRTVERIARIISLLEENVANLPVASSERRTLQAEIDETKNNLNAIHLEWSSRWQPAIDLEDYRN